MEEAVRLLFREIRECDYEEKETTIDVSEFPPWAAEVLGHYLVAQQQDHPQEVETGKRKHQSDYQELLSEYWRQQLHQRHDAAAEDDPAALQLVEPSESAGSAEPMQIPGLATD